ncbi:MAG: hydantoinase B/oxoprolinase family protein [Nitrospina sp.]|nr:hydantoinase B/oxoprolinase family protein [Nitrospina sp.]
MNLPASFRFSIDRGGTFTDIYAEVPGGPGFRLIKLLSENPEHYPDPAFEGIRRVIEEVTGQPWTPGDAAVPIDWVRMGTTLATNALLEKKGARTGLVITHGFRDLLAIGRQNRPALFDLHIKKHDAIYSGVVEVEERVRLKPDGMVEVLTPPSADAVRRDLRSLKEQGMESLAVVLLHAYRFPDHETLIKQWALEAGFTQVFVSHEVMPRIKLVDRGQTCLVEAYLTPLIRRYAESFAQAFEGACPDLLFMQSDGGLVPSANFTGSNAILSGPAGGVVGFAETAWRENEHRPVIGFDMGGTSTDVSRFDGAYDWVHESRIAGVHLQTPQLNIHTVAAGGGSRLFFKNGMLVVGPESSGAHPGPVCYRKGGPLSITDANLVLGRLQADFFPHIFGPEQNQPLDLAASRRAFEGLTDEVNRFLQEQATSLKTVEEVARGFVDVANEQMARAIREITQARGHDVRDHVLACFGGAGGQHACELARSLGIRKVRIHRFAGVLSAYGLGLADVVRERQTPAGVLLEDESPLSIHGQLLDLEQQARQELRQSGYSGNEARAFHYLQLAYQGTDYSLMVTGNSVKEFTQRFRENVHREFGFLPENRPIIVQALRVRVVGTMSRVQVPPQQTGGVADAPPAHVDCYFDGKFHATPVVPHESLAVKIRTTGPALIIQDGSTIVLPPECTAALTDEGNIEIEVPPRGPSFSEAQYDPVQLSVFGNRFMSIAEQMGHVLKRTALSTNIKERHDFSCALFSAAGDLIANAPHQPVHLGSMADAVKAQIELQGDSIREGDVWVSNHPAAGGTHLPDITVVTPVLENGKPIFFVASRGHHVDVGGIAPGSMPAFAGSLAQEGAAIRSFKLVDAGKFQEEGISRILQHPGGKEDGGQTIPGTRALTENLSDLKAQIAANRRGIELLRELVAAHGLETVHAYMDYIRMSARLAVTECLRNLAGGVDREFRAEERMDEGTVLRLRLKVSKEGKGVFDFTGTGAEVKGNLNAPVAVTHSAVLYCLRCLVGGDMPLNQGCLDAVDFIIPPGSLLSPSENAAVAAGNVLTSQRVVDLVFRALETVAASQGCMNNFTFGNDRVAYYETIGGGAGAGPDFDGASGVHTHMTNTQITDPEILEQRYPVLLRRFSLRQGSGGAGRHHGGEGLIREIEFLEPMHVSILSERRVHAPYGLKGGQPGRKGENLWTRNNGETVDLGGKNEIQVEAGDRVRILTPGGGGFGPPAIGKSKS